MKLISGLSTVISAAFIIQLLLGQSIATAWEPTKPDRVRHTGRHWRRRRSDGSFDGRHQRQAQALTSTFHRRQQVRRRRRRGFPARQGKEGRRAHDHHHPVESLHHSAGHRDAV